MAQRVNDTNFGNIVNPGGYSRINVATGAGGLSAFGNVGIVGESTVGPPTSKSTENIVTNFYTPDQYSAVAAKYGSGSIVDAFRALSSPSADPNIPGAPTRIYIYKTNASSTSSYVDFDYQGTFGTFYTRLEGLSGNQVNFAVNTYTAPVQPTTGSLSVMPAGATITGKLRVDGGAANSVTLGGNASPSDVVTNFNNAITSILATGGVDRLSFAGLGGINLAMTLTGSVGVFTLAANSVFAVTPVVGDTLIVPDGVHYNVSTTSVFQGASSQNRGGWVITAVSNTTNVAQITATKLSSTANTTSAVVPANFSTTFSATPDNDLQVYSPVKVIYKAGANRSSFAAAASTNVSVSVSGAVITLNFLGAAVGFTPNGGMPTVGDDLYIPSTSVVAATTSNVGWYSISNVYSVTGSCYIVASRLNNGSPVNVASTSSSATPNNDFVCNRPWHNARAAGFELSDSGGSLNITSSLYTLGTTTASPVISSIATPVFNTGTEYQASLVFSRSADGLSETYDAVGGTVAMSLGYFGTTASAVVSTTGIATTVTGGNGANLTITFLNFPTVGDLVDYINLQTGYAATATAAARAMPLLYTDEFGNSKTLLDQGTYNCCSSVAAATYPLQIKRGLRDVKVTMAGSPNFTFVESATSGLPEPLSAKLFGGGAIGGTSGANITSGLAALEAVDNLNFIVPLFSQDATADLAAGLTDSTSTYTISAIHAALKSHVLSMSQIKRKKNRLGIASYKGTYANAKVAAAALANARVALAFQDAKTLASTGNIKQFAPWMGACVAAGMAASGLGKNITHKFANLTGFVNPAGFNSAISGNIEDALTSGLLVLSAPVTGGVRWVSDQTSYSADDSAVYNSLGNMYISDFLGIDLATAADNAIVGQSIADVSAAGIKGIIETKLSQYLQNKLITPSTGAPAGYSGLSVKVSGVTAQVSLSVYIATAIFFVLFNLNVNTPTQNA